MTESDEARWRWRTMFWEKHNRYPYDFEAWDEALAYAVGQCEEVFDESAVRGRHASTEERIPEYHRAIGATEAVRQCIARIAPPSVEPKRAETEKK